MPKEKEDLVQKFLRHTWSGEQLLKKHSLTEYGFWKILGEDPNCDLGGYHHQPDLGTYEGQLEHIVAYAVKLPEFWHWGSGGDIKKISKARKITAESVYELEELRTEEAELEAKLKEVRAKRKAAEGK